MEDTISILYGMTVKRMEHSHIQSNPKKTDKITFDTEAVNEIESRKNMISQDSLYLPEWHVYFTHKDYRQIHFQLPAYGNIKCIFVMFIKNGFT